MDRHVAGDFEPLLRAAIERRPGPFGGDAVRLFDGAGEGLVGVVVERFGGAHRVSGPPRQAWVLEAARRVLGGALFWRFGHAIEGGPDGDLGRRIVDERGLRFEVRLLGNRNTGLFLDGRAGRAWVRAQSDGRRVLNLFAYTCAFGVAAAAGGARATVNVDPVPAALARGQTNYRLGQLPIDGRTFWRADAQTALRRAQKSGARFDGIVLDPPPVVTGGRRGQRTELGRDLRRLARGCLAVLDPGGWLLVSCALRSLPTREVVAAVGAGEPIWEGTSEADFRPLPSSPRLRLLAFGAPQPPR